jgi:hypothetical protein
MDGPKFRRQYKALPIKLTSAPDRRLLVNSIYKA